MAIEGTNGSSEFIGNDEVIKQSAKRIQDQKNKLKGRIILGVSAVLTGFAIAGALTGAHQIIQHAAQAHNAYSYTGQQVLLGFASGIGSNVGAYLLIVRGGDLWKGTVKKSDYFALSILAGTGIAGFGSAIHFGIQGVKVSGTLVGSLSGPVIMLGYKGLRFLAKKIDLKQKVRDDLRKIQLYWCMKAEEIAYADQIYDENKDNKKEIEIKRSIIKTEIEDKGLDFGRIKEYLKLKYEEFDIKIIEDGNKDAIEESSKGNSEEIIDFFNEWNE